MPSKAPKPQNGMPTPTSSESKEVKEQNPKFNYWDLVFNLREKIQRDIEELGVRSQPIARNWKDILEPSKKLIQYLTAQAAEMSDLDHPDPTWKNFSKEAIGIIDKLQPIIDELSKEQLYLPQLLGQLHTLLDQLPRLLINFDKLQLHIRAGEMLNLEEELKQDFPNLVMQKIEQHLPHYKRIKQELETQYKNFTELDAIQDFPELSYIEKISIISAMEDFNKTLEILFLTLNKISIQLGIKEGYLLERKIFFNGESSINSLCEEFTKFYKATTAKTDVPPPPEESLFPFQEKIILQQKAILAEHKKATELTATINKVIQKNGVSIKLLIEKKLHTLNLKIAEKQANYFNKTDKDLNKKKKSVTILLRLFEKNLEINNNDSTYNIQTIYEQCKREYSSFSLPKELEEEINSIIGDVGLAINQLRVKAGNFQTYIEIRTKKTEDKRSGTKIIALIKNALATTDPETEIYRYLQNFLQKFEDKIKSDNQLLMNNVIRECVEQCKKDDEKFNLGSLITEITEIPVEMSQKFEEQQKKKKAILASQSESKEEKADQPVAVPVTNYSRVKAILTNIASNAKQTKVMVDDNTRENRSSKIILLIESELAKLDAESAEHKHLQMFLNIFKESLKNTKKDINKLIKETLTKCRATDTTFILDDTLYQAISDRHTFSFISKMEKGLQLIYGQLEVMLDKNIYQQFILHQQNPNAVTFSGNGWIKPTGLALTKIKHALEKYKELSAYLASENIESMRGISPKEQLIIFAEKSQALTVVTKELVSSYIELENDPFVKVLLSVPGLKSIISPNDNLVAEEEQKPEEEDSLWPKETEDPLEAIFKITTKLYQKSAKHHAQDDQKIEETTESILRSQKLIAKYKKLKKLDANKIHISNTRLLSFLLNNTSELYLLLSNLSLAFDAIESISKKEFSRLIQKLNLSLKELVLLFNRIEIEFNFSKGYFTQRSLEGLLSKEFQELLEINKLPFSTSQLSFDELITVAYKKLEGLNYTFPVGYPFTEAVIQQEKTLYSKAKPNTLKKKYSGYFIAQSVQIKKEINSKTRKAQQQIAQKEINQINTLINANIAKLDNELNANNTILKRLLKKLTYQRINLKSLDTSLTELAKDPTNIANIYLLYQSHSKQLMETLEQKSATRQDILNELDISINQLSTKRLETYYFFSQYRRTALEDTIEAYKLLREFLAKPGTSVTDFRIEDPYHYKLLVEHNKPLLERLLKFSEESIYLKDERMIAGDVYPTPAPTLDETKAAAIEEHRHELIDARIKQLKSEWNFNGTKANKIKLLEALQSHLQHKKSLAEVLTEIRKDKTLGGIFYLLQEGRTGKMIKTMEQFQLSKKDILHEITVEIARLKQQRHKKFYFAEKSKKLLIENRIQACTALSKLLKGTNQTTVADALAALDDKNRKLIQKYETGLIDSLTKLEKNINFQPAINILIARP